MTFRPPHCPNATCTAHTPGARFLWRRCGFFHRACDGRAVQRFRCLVCRKHFSIQTFRVDYRLRLPSLHFDVFRALISKVSLRQAARSFNTRRRTIEHRQLLLGRHARLFQFQQLDRAPFGLPEAVYLLDEMETFEGSRRLQPVTVPMLVERASAFVVDVRTAELPARGRLKPKELRRKAQLEAERGVRRSGSSAAVQACLETLRDSLTLGARIEIVTDSKATYPGLIQRVLGGRARHESVEAGTKKSTEHALFKLHVNQAMLRDGLSRWVRRNWSHTKRRERLEVANWIWVAWRNWIRYRTNKDRARSAASTLGLASGRWTVAEVFRWRIFSVA